MFIVFYVVGCGMPKDRNNGLAVTVLYGDMTHDVVSTWHVYG